MKKLNILQLIGEFTCGGAETVVINLTNRLKKEGWNVIVSARMDGPLSAQLTDKNCVHFIGKKKALDIRYLSKLVSLIRENDIDLIHSHLFGNDLNGFIAAKYAGVKIIQTIHGMDSIASRKRVVAYNIMVPFVDRIVTVSESLKQEFEKSVSIKNDKICTIHNGVSLERSFINKRSIIAEIGISNSFPIIGAVGNVKPVKGYDTLIRAACLIIKKYPEAKFLIVGDVSEDKAYKEELDGLIYKLGLKGHIKYLGYRQDAYKILSLFDIYVLPSRSEGLSIALLEAMSLKKPIVATNVGGNVKALENGKTALLVPSRGS